MSVNLRALIGKLNHTTRSAVESAAGLCLSRTHYDVEIEHYLVKLLDNTDGDSAAIFKQYGLDRSKLASELAKSLDHLKTGNGRTPAISQHVAKMLDEAWRIGSLDYGATQVRTGHTIIALLTDDELARIVGGISKELGKISVETLKRDFATVVGNSDEESSAQYASAPSSAAQGKPGEGGAPRPGGGKTPNLDAYTVNLTERAKAGKIDNVLGRDFEIRQVIDILLRRRQNNPILVGEAGVGKTAVVEGFALRIANGDVPPPLQNVTLRTLDLALLQAGAGVKGEFENRLKGLIDEVKNSATPIILFIDEAHTMIGAGGAAGQNDAANLLKPALARGELRTMAATTWSEYKKYFEKDPALSRRFQLVKIEEPTEDVCMQMLRGLLPSLEKHHNVRIVDSGLEAAVRLSHRYLPDRQLPDKAVSVLDTTCARLALDQSATPSALEAVTRRIEDLDVQKRVLDREVAVGANHGERLEGIAAERKQREDELNQLTDRWKKESGLVSQIREIRQQLEQHHSGEKSASNAADLKAKLTSFDNELEALQGQKPLIRVVVDAGIVGEVISGWTGIPVGKMLRDEMGMVLEMEKHLGARVIGQDVALEQISRRVRTSRAGIEDPQKPKGVFMLVGPSGVGKTETALALSDLLYGGEQNLITINMSEFQEAHKVSTLKGSPPGYVGYGEGGVLTEAVRRRPYSVVLLDEVEKAHPDVLELFFQVFDKGRMEDGEGREIDFKNTIIILTTNAGTETIMTLTADPETMPSHEGLAKALKPELDKTFKPAFLGRMVIIPYFPVRDENLKQIVRLKINKIRRRIAETHKVTLKYGEDVVNAVAARCTEVESGARNVDNILSNTMLPEMSRALLAKMAEGGGIGTITLGVGSDGNLTYDIADADVKRRGGVSAADAVLGSSLSEEQPAPAL
jgi:type VI secretion system protein VasG